MSGDVRPDAFLLGAEKCGTTSLARWLAEHPDIFALVHSHSRYFSMGDRVYTTPGYDGLRYSMTAEEHWRLFDGGAGARVVVETAPGYLPVSRTAPRIRDLVPDARMVVVLRQPAWRAWSHFNFLNRDALESIPTFAEALAAEERRIAEGWQERFYYRDTGRYARHLRHWFEHFSRDRFLILRYEELRDEPEATVERAYRFLGVDPAFRPDLAKRYNVSGRPRNAVARALLSARHARRRVAERLPHRLVRWVRPALTRRPEPPFELLDRLTLEFRDDIAEVEELLDWDLSTWKDPTTARRAGSSTPPTPAA